MSYAELTKVKKQISELIPNVRNPRKHPDKQLQQLQGSVKTYRYSKGSIVVQKGTNKVLAGHGMLTALKAEGFTEVDVIEADLTDDLANAFLIADNRLGETSEWDIANLDELLKELAGKGIPADYMGFEQKELNELLGSLRGYEATPEDDDIPEVVEPITQKGDIWYLGSHKVMNGDSTCKDDVDRLMGGVKADMVFTDP
ncbi:MAG: DNA methylase N-4, partial [Ignavibacteria bacterium]|nr:DNA methylase N-4 [Ignavibacteria bacterium]